MAEQVVRSQPAPAQGTSMSLYDAINGRIKARMPNTFATFQTAEELWEVFGEYLKFLENNPIEAVKMFTNDGTARTAVEPRPRMPTFDGLYAFLGVSKRTFQRWSDPTASEFREELVPVMEAMRSIIRDIKFTAASAGVAHAGLMMRDLELGDRMTINNEGLQTVSMRVVSDEPAIHVHPDDPDGSSGWLFTQSQIDQGIALPPRPPSAADQTLEYVAGGDGPEIETYDEYGGEENV